MKTLREAGRLNIGAENSPEGENGMSRVYLGIHWMFDQQDGITLGNAIAEYAAGHYFQAVPEPSTMLLVIGVFLGVTHSWDGVAGNRFD